MGICFVCRGDFSRDDLVPSPGCCSVSFCCRDCYPSWLRKRRDDGRCKTCGAEYRMETGPIGVRDVLSALWEVGIGFLGIVFFFVTAAALITELFLPWVVRKWRTDGEWTIFAVGMLSAAWEVKFSYGLLNASRSHSFWMRRVFFVSSCLMAHFFPERGHLWRFCFWNLLKQVGAVVVGTFLSASWDTFLKILRRDKSTVAVLVGRPPFREESDPGSKKQEQNRAAPTG